MFCLGRGRKPGAIMLRAVSLRGPDTLALPCPCGGAAKMAGGLAPPLTPEEEQAPAVWFRVYLLCNTPAVKRVLQKYHAPAAAMTVRSRNFWTAAVSLAA